MKTVRQANTEENPPRIQPGRVRTSIASRVTARGRCTEREDRLGTAGLGLWTQRPSVALAERMRRGSEREAVLAGPGEPASQPLLVELMKLSLPVTTQSLARYPHAVHGDAAHPGTHGARACAGVSHGGMGVSEGGGGRGGVTAPEKRVGLGRGDQVGCLCTWRRCSPATSGCVEHGLQAGGRCGGRGDRGGQFRPSAHSGPTPLRVVSGACGRPGG